MKSWFIRNFSFPLYHRLIKSRVMENTKEARQNQWLSQKDFTLKQKNKIYKLLQHAYQNVPFYHDKFKILGLLPEDLKKPETLQRLPLLTKTEINHNQDAMVAKNIKKNLLIPNSTSGSTGEALHFYIDMQSWARRRSIAIRNQEWIGINLGDRSASLWGASMDIKKGKTLRGVIHRWLNNYIVLSSYELSEESLLKKYRQLNEFKPLILTSYPGPLAEMAAYMLKNNLKTPSIKTIISSAETLHSWQKEIVESAFDCPVFNRYGCREFGAIAQECLYRKGLHINTDRFFFEIIGENQQPCECGQKGEIVITDLDNFGMPLIRYRIGDIGILSDHNCSCGRVFPLLERVEGRSLDVVRSLNGNALGGTFWTLLFRSRPGIKSFQVIQETINGIKVSYIVDPNIKEIPFQYFIQKIHDKCGSDFQIEFQEVNKIKKTSSGKTRFIISKLQN